MTIGSQVYHIDLHLNLIVCQVDYKGKIICINPQIINDGVYQTLTVSKSRLIKGWRDLYT